MKREAEERAKEDGRRGNVGMQDAMRAKGLVELEFQHWEEAHCLQKASGGSRRRVVRVHKGSLLAQDRGSVVAARETERPWDELHEGKDD